METIANKQGVQNINQVNVPEIISKCRARLKKILERLNWTEEGLSKDYSTNSLHKRDIKKANVPPKKATYPESLFSSNSIVLDTPKLQNLLRDENVVAPCNFNELQSNFSRQQKLQVYEHVIENTKKLNNAVVDDVPDGVTSVADIVAANVREAKRKKRKFRKSKPTQIEEMRALVQMQMQALQQYTDNQERLENSSNETNPKNKLEDDKVSSQNVTKSSSEKYHENKNHHRDKPERKSRKRDKSPRDKSHYRSESRQNHRHRDKTTDKNKIHGCEKFLTTRSPTHGRYKSYKDYTKYRENRDASKERKKYDDRNAKKYKRRRSRSSESRHRHDDRHERNRSPHTSSYKKHDKCDHRHRSRSPRSSSYKRVDKHSKYKDK